jgi:hypothetical protein
MLAARVELKNGHEKQPKRTAQSTPATIASKPPALDQNTISSTTSKRQSYAPARLITISGTSDRHHLETVITITWND